MSFLPTWHADLRTTAPLFAPLLKEDISLSLLYGLCAGAVLWAVRDLPHDADIQQAVREVGLDDKLPFLQMIVGGWSDTAPLHAARNLTASAKNSPELKTALDRLLAYFLDDLLAVKLIQPPHESDISVSGLIMGGNINVGGTQNVIGDTHVIAGDLIIQTMPKGQRTCPSPTEEPVHFGGRDAQLNELLEVLRAGQDCAITALKGIGGMGKTTLARVLAARLYKAKVFRAVLWADVTRNPNFITLINGWAHYADSAFETRNQTEEQIALRVKGLLDDLIAETCEDCEPSRVLVVLDDVWENGKQVARLLMKAKPEGSTVLITTRSEMLVRDLNVQKLKSLDRLEEAEAAQLLHSYMPEADEPKLRRLGNALGGHPLAMELAARRILKEQGRDDLPTTLDRCISEYAQRIPQGTPFAALKLEQGEEKDDNLTRSLYHSYEALPTDEDRANFRALGVLAYDEPFDMALLAALWDSETLEDDCDTLRLLSLIESAAGQPSFYRQHPLLRSYARALLREANEEDEIFGRYTDVIMAIAWQFRALPPEEWDNQLAMYYPHLLHVGDALVEQTQTGTQGDTERALAFALCIIDYLSLRREIHRPNWLEMGLQAACVRQAGTEVTPMIATQKHEALFLDELGVTWLSRGEGLKALEYFKQALPLVGDKDNEAAILNNIGVVWRTQREPGKALEYFERALPLIRAAGDHRGEARLLNNIGWVWVQMGEKHKALEYCEQALSLCQGIADRHVEATTLNNIGWVWRTFGEPRKALEYYEHALHLYQSVGDHGGEATTLTNIGDACMDLGEKHKALAMYEKALPLMKAVGNREGEATTLGSMGYFYFQTDDLEKALSIQQSAIAIFREIGAVALEAGSLYNIAIVYEEMGRIEDALQAVQDGKAILLHYDLPQSAGGVTIAQFDTLLTQLQQKPRPADQAAMIGRVMQHFAKIYQQQGADAVRQMLTGHASDDINEQILEHIARMPNVALTPNTLPDETVQMFTQSTYRVKTHTPDRLTEWRETLTNTKTMWSARSYDWLPEVAFVDALLAILDDQIPNLPADNPYADAVQQTLATIQQYNPKDNTEES